MPAAPTALALGRAAASTASGLAVAFAFPPYDLIWLMPFGLAGLMLTVRGDPRGATPLRGRSGLLQGFCFGMGFMLPLMRWITIIGIDAWFALAVLEALFYALMGLTWAWLRPERWWPIGFAATWVGAESLRGVIPFGGLPWGSLAFGLVDTPMVRWGRVGGTALVSFVVVLVVAVLVDVVERRDWGVRGLAGVGVALALAVGSAALPVGIAGAAGTTQVAAVQGNVPGEGMNPFAERRAVLDNHATATVDFAARVRAGQAVAPDVVIWPENSTDIDPYSDASAYEEIDSAVRAIGVPTLVGAVVDGPGPDHVRNMGIVWSPTTGPGEQYVKRHPVPFGEYIPFRGLLTKFITRLDQIPRDFARGTFDSVLDLGPVKVGDVICFEVAYDGLVRDAIEGGGQMLVVQTNNATYTGTGQLEQQFAISRYRAIETGRTVVVAATDGISGIIAPDGSVVAQTEEKTRAVLDENVELGEGITWGLRAGPWVEAGLCALALVAVGLVLLRRPNRTTRLGRRSAPAKIDA
ncbi:MAG TPA: apolipoprotein N-acyltransferase [Nocardioidaceae bacterium]